MQHFTCNFFKTFWQLFHPHTPPPSPPPFLRASAAPTVDESADLFMLATEWPQTACLMHSGGCSIADNVTTFTIHGLWWVRAGVESVMRWVGDVGGWVRWWVDGVLSEEVSKGEFVVSSVVILVISLATRGLSSRQPWSQVRWALVRFRVLCVLC